MPVIGEIRKTKTYNEEIWVACEQCGKERWVYIKKGKPRNNLCKLCASKENIKKGGGWGEKAPNWRGGRHKLDNGYIVITLQPDDFFYPMADGIGRVREHRLIMARHLGRCLLPWEVVHHKNGIRDDNRLENLNILPHSRWHLVDSVTKSYIKQLEKENRQLKKKLGL